MNKIYGLSILATVILFSGCFSQTDKKQNAQAGGMPPLPVGVFVAKAGDIPIVLNYSGQTTSNMDVTLKAKVAGTIEKQFFKAGDRVQAGDKLYLIDQAKYKAVYDSSLANLKVAEANFNNAKTDFDRSLKLHANSAISQKEFDSSKATFESTKASVLAAKANLQNSKIDLDYSVVTAPFSGVIGDSLKDVGSYVSSADSDLVRLTKLNPIYVDFAISDVNRLEIAQKLGSKEWVQLNSLVTMKYEGKDYNGTLDFIDNVIDQSSGTVSAKAKFDNNATKLRPGAFATVEVYGFYQKNGFKIPQVAILQDLVNPFVYTIKDGKVVKNPIKIVSQDATSAIISSGLNDGDIIIIDNFKKIREGQSVQPVQDTKGNK
ncbi:multidrug efflux system CmeABC, periplasmic fusion protein CmeA [Campylobacter iguaniorum]|uniref:Multidrug efflux system CmeABC, periplasmic fusion protein CmeA n=1 Tax=Campylobacter iguaniorum TaxID=1244531 RepID=A0A076F7I8_9BACT|nr:efflux RND transporter periplasmic adaptor subunit [Campylobacter iguaniorum]AII14011.1 multidrug efflux system CmeABC, periplasmic fusion protein CmeA [Campylobacter iguaniorum]ALV23749.1 multidrug efflux system CmeABC, periplasmic fusion protein CmeA [Campylobacter iguaniorum]